MGQAMQDVNPRLISSLLQCAKKTDISLSSQKAAIQAFRLMDINTEVHAHFLNIHGTVMMSTRCVYFLTN